MKRFGITVDEYDRLLVQQDGHCALCPATHSDGTSLRFHVDHDHETGRVRGLLCRSCNMALGILGDDIDGLNRALTYLT